MNRINWISILLLFQAATVLPQATSASETAGGGLPCSADVDCSLHFLCNCPPPSSNLRSAALSLQPSTMLTKTLTCSAALLIIHEHFYLSTLSGCLFALSTTQVYADNYARICPDKSGRCVKAFSTSKPQPPKRDYSVALFVNVTGNVTGAILCLINHNVVDHVCTKCEGGQTIAAGGVIAGENTECMTTHCLTNFKVVKNTCTACEAGTTSEAGGVIAGGNTVCTPTYCLINFQVVDNKCSACAIGKTVAAGGLATGDNTACVAKNCLVDQFVVNHVCTNCASGTTRPIGDTSADADTACAVPAPCPTGSLGTCIPSCDVTNANYGGCVQNCLALCSS